MFWGLVLEPGKRYSTTVDKAFHVSMACLDCSSVNSDNEVLYVLLENDGQEYRICNLSKKGCFQVNLDLSFMTGDSIAFELKGSGIVHLSGYILPEDDDDDFPGDEDEDMDEIEDEEEDSISDKLLKGSKKALANAIKNAKKKQKLEESDDDDEDDDDDDGDEDDFSDADDDDDDDEEEDDDDEDDDDDDEDQEDLKKKSLAQKKGAQKKGQSPVGKVQVTPGAKGGKPQTPVQKPQTPSSKPQTPAGKMINGTTPDSQQSGKKRKRSKGGAEQPTTPTNQQPQKQQQNSQQKNKKQRLSNGLTIKDIKVGNGPVAKAGQTVRQ